MPRGREEPPCVWVAGVSPALTVSERRTQEPPSPAPRSTWGPPCPGQVGIHAVSWNRALSAGPGSVNHVCNGLASGWSGPRRPRGLCHCGPNMRVTWPRGQVCGWPTPAPGCLSHVGLPGPPTAPSLELGSAPRRGSVCAAKGPGGADFLLPRAPV